jgi:hypothetical protein
MSPEKTVNVPVAAYPASPNVTQPSSKLVPGLGAQCDGHREFSDHVAGLFACVAWRVAAAWLVASVALLATTVAFEAVVGWHFVAVDQLAWVSLASGLITLASLVPGLVIGRGVPADKVALTGTAVVATSSALGIRFAGTVALFVACRYHFGEESSSIAFSVIGWYVFLTSIEVHGLARGLTSLDQIQDFGRRNS